MLTLDIEEFLLELEDGSFKNVGPPNKAATVKLYHVESAEAREFGDKRVKLAFEDGEGNEVEVALFPEELNDLVTDIEQLRAESEVLED